MLAVCPLATVKKMVRMVGFPLAYPWTLGCRHPSAVWLFFPNPSGGQTRIITKWSLNKKSRNLFRSLGLRLWEPRPAEQGGFWIRSVYVLFCQLLPSASSLS